MSRPCIVRLARVAGVKTMSEECYSLVRIILAKKLKEVLGAAIIANMERNTKTLMAEDIYNALSLLGQNVTRTTDLKNIRFVVKNADIT